MLYTEIIAVRSEIHAKHINALWAEQFLNAKAGGTQSKSQALKS
jgi:hypothetical protein